jgi:hypothetical protein
VFVYRTWVTCLADNFKKIFVRHEEESWEAETLVVKELVEVLLDLLKSKVHIFENIDEVANVRIDKCLVSFLFLVDALHFSLEFFVDSHEQSMLLSEECLDISLSHEDAFQVLPHALYLNKHLKCFSNTSNLCLPEIDLLVELSVILGALVSRKLI